MPLIIPNTTVNNDSYDSAHTFAGNDIFASGYFTVANNAVLCEILMGPQGQARPIPEQYLPPGTYQIQSNAHNPFSGLKFKRGLSGVDSQVFGAFWYPRESVLQGGNPFTTTISPSGGVSAGVGVYDKNTTLVDVTLTLVETDIYNKTVKASDITGTSVLRLTLLGDYLHNLAGEGTFRIYLGATKIYESTNIYGNAATVGAARQGWEHIGHLFFRQAVNSEFWGGHYLTGRSDTAAPGAGEGAISATPILGAPTNTALVDWSTDQFIRVTVQQAVSNVAISFRKFAALLELL